jgi:protein-tyrosine phosphatase
MSATLFVIPRDGRGRLATMACPRGGDWLDDELDALKNAGVGVLVSALTNPELAELQLNAEPELARQAGLTYVSFPIPDRGAPEGVAAVTDLVGQLEERLTGGEFIVVHCRAGIGRSSLIAAAVLVREGLSPEEAWERISAARGLSVPDTEAQRAWLAAFAGTVAPRNVSRKGRSR